MGNWDCCQGLLKRFLVKEAHNSNKFCARLFATQSQSWASPIQLWRFSFPRGRTVTPAWHIRIHMQWQKVQNIMSQASCALRGQPWSQKPVLEKHWESWFAVDIIFGRDGNNSKLARKLRHLSASRDPGVKTAETNRIVEQVLLNLKTLLLSLFVFL